jgi:hypothetical protein
MISALPMATVGKEPFSPAGSGCIACRLPLTADRWYLRGATRRRADNDRRSITIGITGGRCSIAMCLL